MSAVREADGMINLDADQIIRTTADVLEDGSIIQKTINVGGTLVPKVYDGIEIQYIVSGNGTGEPGVVTYKLGVVTVAVLTLTYDVSNRLTSVVKV